MSILEVTLKFMDLKKKSALKTSRKVEKLESEKAGTLVILQSQ